MSFLKDPISSLTHFFGVLLSILALILLINKANGTQTSYMVASIIFGVSLILLYSASTIYHAVISPKWLADLLHRIDHMMIFVLIAGTYTPVCLLSLGGRSGITIWALAILGVIFKLFWMNAPRWLATGLYLAMGWLIVFAIFPLYKALDFDAIIWLVLGGVSYSIGAIIYGTKKPNIQFKNFGFHEIFHLFVLLGSFCHFIMIYNFVVI